MSQLMECGCVGAATHHNAHDGLAAGHPSCVTHLDAKAACTPMPTPSLEGRFAKCGTECVIEPSSTRLAFFEYRGPGSPASRNHCAQCGYYESAHESPKRGWPICLNFRPHGPYDFDSYYCGCRGWD